jgi:type IV pilus assembly protein PilA
MRISQRKTNRKGIAMTEYLIVLAVVAIAAITVTGLFGQSIKNMFSRTGNALDGTQVADQSSTISTGLDGAAATTNGTANFDKQ